MKEGVDYIGVGVGAVIINQDKKLFLALRGERAKNERGKWETPGGTLELGETMAESLIREILEEYGCKIEIIEQLHAYDHIIPEDHQHWVAISYICKIIEGEPQIMEIGKCAEIGWFSLEEASQLPLAITAQKDVAALQNKFPQGLPSY